MASKPKLSLAWQMMIGLASVSYKHLLAYET